jgi:hypothetical protein
MNDKKDGWIKISDKLPPVGKMVILCRRTAFGGEFYYSGRLKSNKKSFSLYCNEEMPVPFIFAWHKINYCDLR